MPPDLKNKPLKRLKYLDIMGSKKKIGEQVGHTHNLICIGKISSG